MDSPNKDICKECGAFCCRYIAYPKANATKECREYHEIKQNVIKKDDKYWIIDQPCPHIQDDHTCDIYETKPKFCTTFPTDKSPVSWFEFCELLRTNPPEKRGQLKVLK